MEKIIELKNLTKNFDDQQVLKGINLDIHHNEFLTLLGPSGCGKTTTLRIIAGFEEASSGEVLFDGMDISKIPAYKREINTVFQKYALFPHMNVFDNVAFGLNIKKMDKAVIKTKVERMLIGKRGQTLDSLQYIISLVVNKESDSYIRIKVDTENYRERRKATLENLAKNLAYKVKRTRRPVSLEPMNPYERRVIHSVLQNDRYVETHSEGEEPYRKVVITLKKDYRERSPRSGYNREGRYNRENNYNRERGYRRERSYSREEVERPAENNENNDSNDNV